MGSLQCTCIIIQRYVFLENRGQFSNRNAISKGFIDTIKLDCVCLKFYLIHWGIYETSIKSFYFLITPISLIKKICLSLFLFTLYIKLPCKVPRASTNNILKNLIILNPSTNLTFSKQRIKTQWGFINDNTKNRFRLLPTRELWTQGEFLKIE